MEAKSVNDNWTGAPNRGAGVFLLTTVALFGATAIVAQVLLLREALVVVAGNELFIALFFGCWFVGVALGAALGALLVRGRRREEADAGKESNLAAWASLFLIIQIILLPLLIIAIRGYRARAGFEAWRVVPFWPLLKMALSHLAPFSFLTGLTFPMLCRLAAQRGKGGRSVGSVFALESLGSLAGGVLASLVFSVHVLPLTAAWMIGAVTAGNLAVFLGLTAPSRSGLPPSRSGYRVGALAGGLLVVVFLILLITPLRPAAEKWSLSLRRHAYDSSFRWLEERYTPYQHLALVAREGQYSLLSNGQFVATFPDPYTTSHTAHLLMSQAASTSRILVVGGGETGLLRVLLTYPGATIDTVEIDPQILALVRPYLDASQQRALADPRVRIVHEDPRRFMRRQWRAREGNKPVYDIVILNAPDPSTAALNRFYTREFFALARRLLGPSGVLATRIQSGVNYLDPELFVYIGSVYVALSEVFGHVLATPGTEAVLFATSNENLLTSNVEKVIARHAERGVRDSAFSPLFFHTAYEQDQLRFINEALRAAIGRVRANTDLEPITYLYHLRLWNRFAGERGRAGFFARVERYDWRWVVALAALLLLGRLAAAWRWPLTSDRAAWIQGLVALFATGFTGMVASILLLLLYQNYHGSLYREVGLLVALFMAGLAGGSFAANRAGRVDKARLLGRMGLAAAGFWAFFFLLEKSIGGAEWGGLAWLLLRGAPYYYVAMIAAGFLTGVQFPLVGRLAAALGRDPGRAGGALESLDHAGACLGAFVTGIVLVPVSGVAATMLTVRTVEMCLAISLLVSAIALLRRRA